jgi:AcrR family transcriptional regulator
MASTRKPAKAQQKKRPRKPQGPAEVSPRIARRERRRERSREEIVEATRRVLLRKGIAATTLEAVAHEVGLTKAALYYYYPSKHALLFEIMYGTLEANARAVHDGVAMARDGSDALRAIIRETVRTYASRLDDFRLAFLHGQVAGPGTVHIDAAQFAQIHALNDVAFADATRMLSSEWRGRRGAAGVEPRVMAFLANVAAIGLLTVKGTVESVGDPLRYSDEQLIEGLARIFAAAAAPAR